MEEQRKKRIYWGLKRMKELLDGLGLKDIQVKRTSLEDWSVQFARELTHNPIRNAWNDHDGEPIWEPEWIPVSELPRRVDYQEIWAVFRERICVQTTLAHAAIGDIINSKGVNTGGTAAKPSSRTVSDSRSKKPSRSSARRTVPDTLVSVKQEDSISLAEQEHSPIDLTMEGDSLPSTSVQDPEQPSQVEVSDHIDLTVDEVVDLTTQMIIDISNDDPSEETRMHQSAGESAPPHPDNEVLAQKDDSDHDSLFDDPEPEPTRTVRFADNEMELDVPLVNSEAHSPESRAPLPAQPNMKPTSERQQTKRGRKRALDCGTEGETVEPPRKMVAFSRESRTPSLLTAVKGKVVEVSSNGKYRPFDARASAGSELAARTARSFNQKGPGDQRGPMPMQNCVNRPPIITNPDELEDYEDEEEPAIVSPKTLTPDPELDAVRDKWNQAKMPKTVMDRIAHLLQPGPLHAAPSLFGPPLFLLRISATRTLRLMARNCSEPHTQFYAVTPAENAKRKGVPFPEEQERDPAIFLPKYVRHKEHLLDLMPQYHHLAWVASLARQELLKVDMEAAIRRKDMEAFPTLEEDYQKEVESNWRLGEKQRTRVIPRRASIAAAEEVLFKRSCANMPVDIDVALLRRPGSWAELVLHQHGHTGPTQEDKEDYVKLAEKLERENEFLVIEYDLVNEHYKNPHTLIVFASRSRTIGELCGLPEDMMKSRKSLVIVHLGWRLATMEGLRAFDIRE